MLDALVIWDGRAKTVRYYLVPIYAVHTVPATMALATATLVLKGTPACGHRRAKRQPFHLDVQQTRLWCVTTAPVRALWGNVR